MKKDKNYPKLKEQAIALRKKGWSYGEIKREISVSKSTLSLWLKDIVLTREQAKRLYTKKIAILAFGAPSQRERRKREVARIIKKAKKEIQSPLFWDAYQLFGAALYWAEGSKKSGLEVTNSDPHFILFMVNWFERVFNVFPNNLKASLNMYSQQNEQELKSFWSDLTGIPVKNFYKSYVKPSNKGYKKNNLYYGTIKIGVPKSTNMKYQVFGWVKAVLKDIDSGVKLNQRKWESIKQIKRPVNLAKFVNK